MESRIETLPPKNLVGMHMKMSRSNNMTSELWKQFMPRRREVKHRVNAEYISMQVYETNQPNLFAPTTSFEKWAVVEVSTYQDIPDGMDTYTMKGGQYAVFVHHGPASAFPTTMQAIFEQWFPESGYELDDREHFEILPEHYNPTDPEAKEEVWIPIK